MNELPKVHFEIHNIFKIEKKNDIKNIIEKPSNAKSHFSSVQRKNRSLGHLCQNFIKLYSKFPTAIISIDECAYALNVERRRIYDIINILDCFCCLRKKEKNCYYWLGCSQIINYLEYFHIIPPLQANLIIPNLGNDLFFSHPLISNIPLVEYKKRQFRRERSLAMICQQFLLLFASSQLKYLYLDYISHELSSNDSDECNRKTKIRRIYDIANVFQSIGIIKKIHNSESKTMYKWEGANGFRSFLNLCLSVPCLKENIEAKQLEEIKIPTNTRISHDQNYPILLQEKNVEGPQDLILENMNLICPEQISNSILNRENMNSNNFKAFLNPNPSNEKESNIIKKKRKRKEVNWSQDLNLLIEAVNQLEHK